MKQICKSLTDLLGQDYMASVIEGAVFFGRMDRREAEELAQRRIAFFPENDAYRQEQWLARVGEQVIRPLAAPSDGAPNAGTRKAVRAGAAPVCAVGPYRIGEDGRLHFAAKSEHYHAPLGHNFPGFGLLEIARRLGITNITHNNTRGTITRLLEEALVRGANPPSGASIVAEGPRLTRVFNLETGSLACEAAIKLMLSRFWRTARHREMPLYTGRIPVFLVMQDQEGTSTANYHGTTIVAQMLRGMWPEWAARMEADGQMKVVPVAPNDLDDFRTKLTAFNLPPFKTAGFAHEILLMNYGAVRLEETFLKAAHAMCRTTDTPVFVDEIQTGAWYPELFLYRRLGLLPDLVAIGKGFPGGEYAASRLLATDELDTIEQFDALVTNGMQEMAALSYLITMTWVTENAAFIERTGAHANLAFGELASRHPETISGITGERHISCVNFHRSEDAVAFCAALNAGGIDISAQTYKASCPPVALLKLPLVVGPGTVDFLIERMERVLREMDTQEMVHDAAKTYGKG